MEIPSLLKLCVQAAASSNHWTVQRRCLERLPDHAANDLLAELLVRQASAGPTQPDASVVRPGGSGRGPQHPPAPPAPPLLPAPLRPATLELLRHSVTRVALRGPRLATSDWLAVLAGFSHLEELQLLGCSRLTDASLQLLLTAPVSHGGAAAAAAAVNAPPGSSSSSSAPPPARLATSAGSPAPAAAAAESAASWRSAARPPRPAVPGAAAAAAGGARKGGGSSSRGAAAGTSAAVAAGRSGAGDTGGGTVGLLGPSAAAASLRSLDLSGCRKLGDHGLACVAGCRGLTALNISETGVQGPGLAALKGLTALTRLQAGGLEAVDGAALCDCLHPLTRLEHLELWGSGAGCGPDGGEGLLLVLACLPGLRHLSLAWTPLETLPAFPGLQVLDMSHCRLREVWWPTGRPQPDGDVLGLRQLVLRGATLCGAAASSQESGLAALIRHAAPSLEVLDVREVHSADPWVVPLAALVEGGGAPKLTQLHVSQAAVRAEDLELLQAAPALERLAAAGTQAGTPLGAAALAAAGLLQLQDLDLKASGVTDDSVPWLQQLTSLTQLVLAANPRLTLAPPPPPLLAPPPGPPAPPDMPALAELAPEAGHGVAPGGAAAAAAAGVQAGGRRGEPPLEDIWAPDARPQGLAEGAGQPEAEAVGGREMVAGTVAGASSAGGSGGPSLSGPWPLLRKLDLLGTAVGEAGLRALLGGPGRGMGGDGGGAIGGPLSNLEQLKIGGAGFTDAAAAVLAAASLPRLHSLLMRDAPLTGHGVSRLAASCPALRRLELQGCWLVSEQDAQALAAVPTTATGHAAARALVVVNGKAPTAAAAVAGGRGGREAGGAPAQGNASSGAGEPPRRDAGRGPGARATHVSYCGDLEPYDQRLRYSRLELMLLAESPGVPIAASGRLAAELMETNEDGATGIEGGGFQATRLGCAGGVQSLLETLEAMELKR